MLQPHNLFTLVLPSVVTLFLPIVSPFLLGTLSHRYGTAVQRVHFGLARLKLPSEKKSLLALKAELDEGESLQNKVPPLLLRERRLLFYTLLALSARARCIFFQLVSLQARRSPSIMLSKHILQRQVCLDKRRGLARRSSGLLLPVSTVLCSCMFDLFIFFTPRPLPPMENLAKAAGCESLSGSERRYSGC